MWRSQLHTLASFRKNIVLLCCLPSKRKLKYKIIKVYLSGVRFLHISEGFADHSCNQQVHYIVQGIKRYESEEGGGNRIRLPISPSLLKEFGIEMMTKIF